ncbi:MAG: Inner membrane protein YbhI [Pelotomaculum sp. PtaB.Bin104]|nr:MAG: Inner membrane protein YbhI [Pelotomaculum sp. PtaB.Bin104]
MKTSIIELINELKAIPVFSTCNLQDLSRLLPSVEEKSFIAGEILFQSGMPASEVYLVKGGVVRLSSGRRKIDEVSNGFLGEEAVVGSGKYLSDAVAGDSVEVLAIPREQLQKLVDKDPVLRTNFYASLLNHHSWNKMESGSQGSSDLIDKGIDIWKPVGWLLVILLPVLILTAGHSVGFDWNTRLYIAVFVSAVIMWVFRLSTEFIPCLFAVLVLLFLGVAPAPVVLSGFTSGSFFMAMSVFGLGVVLVSSGLTYRLVLIILRYAPRTQIGYNIAIFLTGVLLTPVIPLANGRIGLVSPILLDMVEVLGYRPSGKAASGLSAATFNGFTFYSSIFLSSKPINFVVYGLLPLQVREQFTWAYWALAAAVCGLVIFVLYFLISSLFFRNNEVPALSTERIEAQIAVLGPMNGKEWAALAGILLFVIGVATSSMHKIDTAWIGLAVLYILLALGVFSKKEFQSGIDWPFLIYLGGLLGLVDTMSYLGLDRWIGSNLFWIGKYMYSNFLLFLLLLTAGIFIVRVFLPNSATTAILAPIFLPLAQISGINPWVVGFIILTISDGWVMPYQCSYYVQFLQTVGRKNIYNQMSMLVLNNITNLIRLAAIAVSIPYWRWLGIL